jgi:IMP dehydrogenase
LVVFKNIRNAYGFEDVAIVPGNVTINPDQTSTELELGYCHMAIPILASAMDAIVSSQFAVKMHQAGGLAVMNMEGLQTRYDFPEDRLSSIAESTKEQATTALQSLYSAPIRDELIGKRVTEIKNEGAICAVSFTPQNAKRMAPLAVEAGADIIVVQSTVTTARHISKSYRGLVFSELLEAIKIPVLVGNCVTYETALELMETGIDGILVGVGPGAACTTREVVGVGVPQVTATIDCAAARDEYLKRSGKHVAVITDGGIRTGGDLCKAIVAGADGVMIGTPLAQTEEAPGKGFNWGMAAPHANLPRGTRINVGIKGTLKQVLFGPTSLSDGTQNLVGALKACMGMCGALNIQELHQADMIVAPSIRTEGKIFQMTGRL